MNGLLPIVLGVGLRDGLNPCIFMTCAVFIVHGLWLKRRFVRMGWLRIVFGLVYALGVLAFNFGLGQSIILQKSFVFTAKILYFALGVWAFVLGILFFKDWVLIHRGNPVQEARGETINFFSAGGMAVFLTTVILAVVFSALSTLWPIDRYIIVLGNVAIIRGQWGIVMPLLLGYIVISMWALWCVWAFLAIKNLRLSLLKIACSSIFFTASSCMILMFK